MVKLSPIVQKLQAKMVGAPVGGGASALAQAPASDDAAADETAAVDEADQAAARAELAAKTGAVAFAGAPLTDDGRLPPKWRLRAWWDGFDPQAIADILAKHARSDSGDEAHMDFPSEDDPPEVDAPETKPIDPDDWLMPFDPWDPNRLEVAQYIWGEGFCGVGGPSYVVNLCKLLALKPEMSVMEFGAGLGAGARALVEGFGCWITGFEESGRLVERANHKSHMLGMAKKAKIDILDLGDPSGFGRNYDRVVSRAVLHRFKNKQNILSLINKHMKPTGLVLATDFVAADDRALSDPEVKDWLRHEPFTPFILTAKGFSELFAACDFVVRVDEDVTKEYIDMVNRAWQGADELVDRVQHQPDGAELITVLMRHGELWNRRAKLLKSSKMRMWRSMGTKVVGRPDGMSDW